MPLTTKALLLTGIVLVLVPALPHVFRHFGWARSPNDRRP